MKSLLYSVLLLAGCAALAAQATSAPPAAQSLPSDLGFSYSLPADWEVSGNPASLPQARQQAEQNAGSDAEKKGLQCVQLLLTARRASSVVVEVALPFDCYQQQLTDKDLPGFASGASEGLRNSFNLGEPMLGAYTLAGHAFWIERARGTPKAQPYLSPYTVEVVCSLLQKAAVCWMTMAADDDALQTFERGQVSLEGHAPTALVPANAFAHKPS